MAINYSVCFPYCLALLISVALRRRDATSASVQTVQRNARVLGQDVPPALRHAARLRRGGKAALQPSTSEKPNRQRGWCEALSLGHQAKNIPPRHVPRGRAWDR